MCKKRELALIRNEDNRPLFYKKDIAVLARAGFDFEVSRKVMDLENEDYSKNNQFTLIFFYFFPLSSNLFYFL